jgi:hypothetical protein
MPKLLKIVFILLVLVTVSELGYYLWMTGSYAGIPIKRITEVPSPTSRPDNLLFTQGFLDYISSIKKVDGKRVLWREELNGVLSEVSFTEYQSGNYLFKGYFILSNAQGEQVQRFGVTENRLNGWKFYRQNSQGVQQSISFYDLKPGQRMSYVTNVDVGQHNAINDSDIIDDHFVVYE